MSNFVGSGDLIRHTPRFRAAGIAFGALIALGLPLASSGVAQAAGRELARTGVLEPTYEPIGFDGSDVVAVRQTRIVAFGYEDRTTFTILPRAPRGSR